jgi:dGTPase
VANVADEIAYNNHDVDDGLRSGLLSESALCSVALFRRHYEPVVRAAPQAPRRVLIHETIRGMINDVVTDLVKTSRRNIAARRLRSSDDVRALTRPLIALSPATLADHLALKRYLRRHLYRHEQVIDVTSRAQEMLKAVFQRFISDLKALPPEHADRARAWEAESGAAGRARAVADYVAGMTDRFAFSAYRRLVDPDARLP